jgi:hypothetical protein
MYYGTLVPSRWVRNELMWLLVYLVPVIASALLAVMLWRRKDAPAVGYLCFTIAAGVVTFLLMVDTGWLARVPRFQVGRDIYGVVTNVIALGYKTEMFSPEKLQREVKFELVPEDHIWKSRLRFVLAEPAVPDSVTVWENDVPIAPDRFTVEGRDVTVRLPTTADPRTSENEFPYIIRYFSAGGTTTQVTP